MNQIEVQMLIYENALVEMHKRHRRLRQQMINLTDETEELQADILNMQRRIDAAREKYLKGVV